MLYMYLYTQIIPVLFLVSNISRLFMKIMKTIQHFHTFVLVRWLIILRWCTSNKSHDIRLITCKAYLLSIWSTDTHTVPVLNRIFYPYCNTFSSNPNLCILILQVIMLVAGSVAGSSLVLAPVTRPIESMAAVRNLRTEFIVTSSVIE